MYRQKTMGLVWILVGICFLWDPVVGVVDLLPDVIGWMLVCIGVSALADMHDDLAQAQRNFRRMVWVGLGRVAAELLIFVFLENTREQLNPYEAPVWSLLFAFSFAVLELWFLLPASRSFWRGIARLSECGGARNSLASLDRHGRTLCDRMQRMTAVFLILHTVFAVLPEFAVLTVFREENVYSTAVYQFRNLFRFVAAGVSGIAGLLFLISWVRFFRNLRGETAWLESLRMRYEREILPDVGLLLRRRVGAGFLFFRIGLILLGNVSILYYEFMPDWGCVLLVLCGLLILGSLMKGSSLLVGVGLAVVAVGIPRTVLNIRYLQSFIPQDSLYLPVAYERYFPICVLASVEAVLTALFLGCLLFCLLRMAKDYLARGDALSGMSTARVLHVQRQKAGVIFGFVVLSAGAKIAEIFLQPIYGWIWLVQFVLSLVAFILFSGLLTDLSESIVGAFPMKEPKEQP